MTTTNLTDIFDANLFAAMLEGGYVRTQTHPTQDLRIANYTEKAQYEHVWNKVTLNCRGLIYDSAGIVHGRGFPKFFNWDDSSQQYPPTGPMVLSTKFDGSLGIAYITKDQTVAIATRGSFTSDQALHATEWLYAPERDGETISVYDIYDLLKSGKTPLFEIIYPTNRIVVNYGAADRLALLDVIDNRTGKSDLESFDVMYWDDKAEKKLIAGGFSDSITHDIPQGEEGFVLYWPGSGFRCKMKSAEYVELHRTITGLSKKSVWEMLGQGKTVDQIAEVVPDELHDWLRKTVRELNEKAGQIVALAFDAYESIIDGDPYLRDSRNRGRFAREAATYPEVRPYLFKILDGALPEDLWKMAWAKVKPVGDSRAWGRGEDVA